MARLGQFRRDTAANWAAVNPILADGEFILIATDPTKPRQYDACKTGDGVTRYNDLPQRGYECTQELGNNTLYPMSQNAVMKEFQAGYNPYIRNGIFLRLDNGADALDSKYLTSDYLPINRKMPIECMGVSGRGLTSLAFYDENKVWIKSTPNTSDNTPISIAVADIPENAVFIRSCIKKSTPVWYLRGFNLESVYAYVMSQIQKTEDLIHSPVFNVNVEVEHKIYTFDEVIAAVPVEYRKLGLFVTYRMGQNKWKTVRYIGTDVSNWLQDWMWDTELGEDVTIQRITEIYEEKGNKFNKETAHIGYYINAFANSGRLWRNPNQPQWNASDYIRVTPGQILRSNVNVRDRAFYDKDFKTIETASDNLAPNTNIVVPSDAVYFRFSTYQVNVNSVCLKEQSEGSVVYEDYTRTYKWLPKESNEDIQLLLSQFEEKTEYDSMTVEIGLGNVSAIDISDISGWGATFNVLPAVTFNAIRLPAGSAVGSQVPANRQPKFARIIVKNSKTDTEFIAVSPYIRITNTPLIDIIFPLTDPQTGEYKTVTAFDFSGNTYWVNVSYYNSDKDFAYCGIAMSNPVMTNYVAGSSKYSTSNDIITWRPWSGYPCPAFEHLLLVNPRTTFHLTELNDIQAQIDALTPEKIDISLPDTLNAVVGDTMQIFLRGIVKAVNPYNYDVVITCSKGKMYPRYFEFTPVAGDVGVVSFNVKVKRSDGFLLGQKTCNINVRAAVQAPSTLKNVLCLGDSLTNARIWPVEMYRRLAKTGGTPVGLGYNNIDFVGRKKASVDGTVIGVEGNSGWNWADYLTVGRKAFTFTITAPTVMPAVEAVYRDANNKTYTMWWDYSTTSVKMLVDDMSSTPPASGTLTKVSGTGDATLTYSAAVQSSGNPFWNDATGGLNFKAYVDKWCGGKMDIIYVLLTWNAQYGNRTDFSVFINYAKTLFDHIKTQYPNIVIRLMGVQVPDLREGERVDGSPRENTYTDQYGLVCTALNMNEAYQEFANSSPYNQYVKFVNVSSQVDSEYNMPYTQKDVNTRNSTVKEDVGTNDVHPNEAGYLQIGDIGYRSFVVDFCQ